MESIKNTNFYRSLTGGRQDVELWEDNFAEDGWSFFSVVVFAKGEMNVLAHLRVKDGKIQNRTRDDHGAELWVETK
jgi:major membrane immunogen (membrane-anchored lipoprotein)